MNILFLDDNPERQKAFKRKITTAIIVATSQACIEALSIEDMEWDMVFLDHDLGGEEMVGSDRDDCGMAVVRWISQNEPFIRHIIVHTMNPPAGVEMERSLKDARYKVSRIPFSTMIANLEGFSL